MAEVSREEQISARLARLTDLEVEVAMTEAGRQFNNRDDDEAVILDFIENALDMLAGSEYEVHEGRLVGSAWLRESKRGK